MKAMQKEAVLSYVKVINDMPAFSATHKSTIFFLFHSQSKAVAALRGRWPAEDRSLIYKATSS